jgi:exonuclease III
MGDCRNKEAEYDMSHQDQPIANDGEELGAVALKCIVWNIAWAGVQSVRGQFIKSVVEDVSPGVLCFTETTLGMFPENGYMIESSSDYGYKQPGNRRKVALWSKTPWVDVDATGCESLPSGRFVTGVSQGVRFIGVCIPWKDAHIRTGRKDRKAWEDHLTYLDGLAGLVRRYSEGEYPLCLVGDFNQRIPRSRQPVDVARKLDHVFDIGLQVSTSGILDEEGKQLIDHVSTTETLTAEVQKILPKSSPDGVILSDHSGIVTTLDIRLP